METWAQISRRHFVAGVPGKRFRKLAILCEQQNYRCCYCGIRMIYPSPVGTVGTRHPDHASLEHLLPLSRGGKHGWDNLVAACAGCNMMRSSDIEPIEFYEWRQSQPDISIKQMRKNLGRYRKRKEAKLRALVDHTTDKTTAGTLIIGGCWFCRLRCRTRTFLETLKGWKFILHIIERQPM